MESVRVNYFGKEDWQWALTAKNGLVPPNSRVVQLDGDVELRSLTGDANAYLRTSELSIELTVTFSPPAIAASSPRCCGPACAPSRCR